jgi:hypothetical protein
MSKAEKFENKYILGERMDKGGFGEVFDCYLKADKQRTKKFACKVIYTKQQYETEDKQELGKMQMEVQNM